MTPELVISLVTILAKYGPAVVTSITAILKKSGVNTSDWDALVLIVDKPLHDPK